MPLHFPEMQLSEQQSVATVHASFAAVQLPLLNPPTHFLVVVSQFEEQQSEPVAHVEPLAAHAAMLPSPPPSSPPSPLPLTAPLSLPHALMAQPIAKNIPQRTARAFHVIHVRRVIGVSSKELSNKPSVGLSFGAQRIRQKK